MNYVSFVRFFIIFEVVRYLYYSILRDYSGCATGLMFITVRIYRTTVNSEKILEDQVPHNRNSCEGPEIWGTAQP